MSLKTLLEAAEFLELEEPRKTRDGNGKNFHRYCKKSPSRYDSDESNEDSRERRRSGGAGTREVHNKLEKNRRAHLKECFDTLKYQVPSIQDKKTSNLTILRGALRYIQALRRKEKDFEQEMQKWALEKIALQQRVKTLKGDLGQMNIEFDLDLWVSNQDQETASTSTASENGNAASDEEEKKTPVISQEMKTGGVAYYNNSKDMEVLDPPKPRIPAQPNPPRPKLLNAAIMAPAVPQIYRTPVTQILHQQLTQRAALHQLQQLQRQQLELQQRQQEQQKELTVKAVSTVPQPTTIPQGVLVGKSAAPVTAQPTLTMSINQPANPAPFTPVTTMSKLATAIAMPINATPKSIGQALAKPASSTTAAIAIATTTISTAVTQTVTKATPSIAATPSMQVGIVGAPPLNQSLPATLVNHRIANQNTVMSTNIKQLLSTPGTHLVSAGTQLAALNPIRTSTLGQMLSAVTNVAGVTIAGTNQMSAVHPVVSFTHITPGTTHIVSPVSVVSPNVHVSNLSQQQLNTMIQQQPLLKSLNQLPLLQPQFLQAGQVVGQQMVKPVVLVPSVAVTSSSQPGQLAVSVTRATS